MPRALTGLAAVAVVLVGFWTVRLRLTGIETGVVVRSLEDRRDRVRLRVEELRCAIATLEGPVVVLELDRERAHGGAPPGNDGVAGGEGATAALASGQLPGAAIPLSRTP